MRKTGKKLYALLLAASMAALTACGGGSGDAGSGTAGSSAAPAAGGETQAQEEIPEGASVSQETDIVAAVNVPPWIPWIPAIPCPAAFSV